MSAAPGDGPELLRRALELARASRLRIEELEAAASAPVAVLGTACRFPGCADVSAYWELLRVGRTVVSEVPPGRWNVPAAGAQRGAFLADVEAFDHDYFRIGAREAVAMDPQHRLLLEVVHEALEDAGLRPWALAGSRTGVFVGMMAHDHAETGFLAPELISSFTVAGNGGGIAAGRIAHTFGLEGPVLCLDTNCSSSLVALHYACQSLRAGECDLAIVAGVNVMLSPIMFSIMGKAGALAADGRCKAFDERADGYGRGEGCGAVVLRRLADARRAGDQVLAQVLGSAVNHDGRSSALPVPKGPAQEQVIRRALRAARVEPGAVAYVEGHGTGTPLGDPIEVEALANVFARLPGAAPLLLGACKANLGHLEAAAGMASLIKAVEIVRRGVVPPQPRPFAPSRRIPWERCGVAVATEARPLAAPPAERVAGVSAFGLCGTNAHAVVGGYDPGDGADAGPAPADACDALLLPVSAHDRALLPRLLRAYRELLGGLGEPAVARVCRTAAVARDHRTERVALVGEDGAALLRRLAEAEAAPRAAAAGPPRVVAWLGAPDERHDYGPLAARAAAFGEAFAGCAAVIARQTGYAVAPAFVPSGGPAGLDRERALWRLAVALATARLCERLGIGFAAVRPAGAPAAAVLAGRCSLEAAVAATANGGTTDGVADATPAPGGAAEDEPAAIAGGAGTLWLNLGAPLAASAGAAAGAPPAGAWANALALRDGAVLLAAGTLARLYELGADLAWEQLYPRAAHWQPALLPKEPFVARPLGRLRPPAERTATAGLPPRGAPGEPESAAERIAAVAALVARAAGLAAADLDPEQPLGELGLDSLSAVDLAEALAERFELEPGAAAALSALSVAQIAQRGAGRAETPPAAAPPAGRAALVALKAPPAPAATLVLVHPVGGSVWPYAALAQHLPGDLAVRAVESTRAGPGTTIDALADDYLGLLAASGVPAERSLFAGWSMGGYVAFAMARRLAAATGLRRPVLLIDSVWQALPGERLAFALFALDAGLPREAFEAHLPPAVDRAAALRNVAEQLGRRRPGRPPPSAATMAERFAVFSANLEALACHEPGGYDGPVALVRARQGFGPLVDPGRPTDWSAHAPRLRTTVLETDHFAVVRPPAVARVAEALQSLRQAAAEGEALHGVAG